MNKIDVKKLCRQAGRKPFDDRATFNQRDFAKCPVHSGEGDQTLHLIQRDGIWLATCFSGCSKTWDAVGFVMAVDRIPFLDAVTKLGGKEGAEPSLAPATSEKAKPKAMTLTEWVKWGVELTPEHITRLAASRKDKSADFETFKALGCRVKGEYIGFPCSYTVTDGNGAVTGVEFDYIHLRHLDTKELVTEHAVSLHGFFNLDTVNAVEDVYVVESDVQHLLWERTGIVFPFENMVIRPADPGKPYTSGILVLEKRHVLELMSWAFTEDSIHGRHIEFKIPANQHMDGKERF